MYNFCSASPYPKNKLSFTPQSRFSQEHIYILSCSKARIDFEKEVNKIMYDCDTISLWKALSKYFFPFPMMTIRNVRRGI